MAVNVDKVAAGGIDYLLYGVIDSANYFQGCLATAPAAGLTGSGLALLKGVKSFPFTPNEPERTYVTGDGGVQSQFLYKPVEFPATEAEMSISDNNFAALAMTQVVHDIGGFTFLGLQPGDVTYRDIVFVTACQAKSHDSGSLNVAHWYGQIILKTNCYYRGPNGNTERENKSFLYSIAANSTDRYPWGLAFSTGSNGDDEYVAVDWTSPYRLYIDRWTGDNSRVDFTLTKTLAADDTNTIAVYVDGVAATYGAGAPGAGAFGVTGATLTMGTAPGTDAKVVALYGCTAY